MGRISTKENKNIYQITRENCGFTRAEAADKMEGVTEYRLVKIEGETVDIQPADVLAMSERYNAPHLCNHYCSNDCRIGQKYVPEVKFKDNIHEILVNMVVSLETVNKGKSRLMEILADGKIQQDELDDFIRIENELERISTTVDALRLWCEKMRGNDQKFKTAYEKRKNK